MSEANVHGAAVGLTDGIISRLRSLPYAAYLDVVSIAMEKAGYSDVKVLRGGRDRNAGGGVDLTATAAAGFTAVSAVAQAKQYDEPVPKRYVQEIRGAALGAGAQHAVIVSTRGSRNPPAPRRRGASPFRWRLSTAERWRP